MPSLESLWAELRTRPTDPDVRSVLADALQAAGDPLGEYIALSTVTTREATRRAAELLTAHENQWCAGIPGQHRASRRFERGFLVAVSVNARADELVASLDARPWWTLEELVLDVDPGPDVEPLTAAEAVLARTPSLDAFFDPSKLIGKLTQPVPNVRVVGAMKINRVAFPALEMLASWFSRVEDWLEQRPDVPRLLMVNQQPVGEALAAYAAQPVVSELRLATNRDRGWLVIVRADDPSATLSWTGGRYVAGSLKAQVDALVASGRKDISVAGPHAARAAFAADVKKVKNAALTWLDAPVSPLRV